MKSNTVLDFVELQLTPPRTRCELFVSAYGVTEKVASGFLKPFLTHLQAVEEQVAQGCSSVRLGHPQFLNGQSWFTKGTIERFVRFVSTPEVLERVKSVEDELAQLEQVRSIQASSLSQAGDIFAGPAGVSTQTDGRSHVKLAEKKPSFKLSRRNDEDVTGGGVEASKVELLRAMELRVHALQQELSTAFDRAIAAGFTCKNIADLIAFSKHFGAERLCTACVNFVDALKTRHEKDRELDIKAGSSCSNTPLHNGSSHKKISCQHLSCNMFKATHDSEVRSMEHSETVLVPLIKETGLTHRGSGSVEVRKRWGPPENIRTEMFINHNETDSLSSSESSNGTSIRSPEIQSTLKKSNIEQDMHPKDTLLNGLLIKNISSKVKGENTLSAGHEISTRSLKDHADNNKRESLSADRCSISFQNVQANCSELICNISSQEASVSMNCRDMKLSSTCCEGNESKVSSLGTEILYTPVVEPTRRLSVQDAISLFEHKQRRDSLDSIGKHRSCKQENDRASLEGWASLSGSMVLKRWDSGKRTETGAGLQGNESSPKPEVAVLDTEYSLSPFAIRPVGSGTPLSHSLQGRHGNSLAQSNSGALAEAASNAQLQPPMECVSARPKETNGQSASSEIVTQLCDGNWHKQFKSQLEKGLARDCFTGDLFVEGTLEERDERGISVPKKFFSTSKIDIATTMPFVGRRVREAAESGSFVEVRQVLPSLGSARVNTSRLQNGFENAEPALPNLQRVPDMLEEEDCETAEVATEQNHKRESLGSSSVISLDHDMHSLVLLADNQTSEDDKDSDGSKGRLYEQYRKLRDAKLLEDQDSKRAERETRLKIMEETLRRRKAEMDARVVRLSKNSRSQARTSKTEALESGPQIQKKHGDLEVTQSAGKDQAKPTASSLSPPSTPCTSKEVPTLKPQGGRKTGAVSQKAATPPRTSNRSISSISPKVIPKSTTVGAGNLLKSMASSRGDNPLARSVPCFANLRKENTKPSPGRPLGSARVHPKNGVIGRTPGLIDTSPLEANGNVPVRTNFSRSRPIKEEHTSRSAVLRKSCATINDLKTLSTSSDDGILAPQKPQMTAEPNGYNKSRRSAAGSFQEAKPFLKKGRGIGPGTGPGVIKQKATSATDMSKSSDEDILISQKPEQNHKDGACQLANAIFDGSFSKDLSEPENMDVGDDVPVHFALPNDAIEHSMRILDISKSNNKAELDGSTAVDIPTAGPLVGTLNDIERATNYISLPVDIETCNGFAEVLSTHSDFEWNDTERATDNISLPIDIQTCNGFAEALTTRSDSHLKFDPDALSLTEEVAEPLSQRDDDTVGLIQNQLCESSACPSFRAVSPPHEQSASVSSPVPPLPPSSSVGYQERLCSPFRAKLESPMGNPATWISSQLQDTDVTHLDRKWTAFQKPVMVLQPKESVKGFKRLLKFGRKGRSSEVAAADCISASTTSEGDDESEEQGRFVEDVSSRGMLFERRFNDVLRDHNQAEEGGSGQLLRSSIPTPPANFKMRDDHMGGGTMLRAPRSFFSLSSFRSKGSEGKS
ncbi:hypothetical protein L7F22_059466 [Adiantum nelumboides]|nr:hypothetical protein [Adiantum nelumboides]